jgi:hypothetical protein
MIDQYFDSVLLSDGLICIPFDYNAQSNLANHSCQSVRVHKVSGKGNGIWIVSPLNWGIYGEISLINETLSVTETRIHKFVIPYCTS